MLLEITPKQKLANLVRELRGDKSQRNFAKLLGVSYFAVQTWEKQAVWPDDENLQKLAKLKGWTQEQLQVYLHIPSTGDLEVNNSFFNSHLVNDLPPQDSTRPSGLPISELLEEVRALPFEAAVQVAQAALQAIEAQRPQGSSQQQCG